MRLIGMVHLAPLPGSPRWDGSMASVVERALADARAIVEGGMDALLMENYGDAPFAPGRVEAATVAAMAVVAHELRRAFPSIPLGVNVHAGAVVADQGLVQSDSYATLRDRRLLSADVRIFADVLGKHSAPLGTVDLDQQARDLVHRGLADGLVVSGRATGEATPLGDLKRVRDVVPGVPLLAGSGVTPDTARALLDVADGLIVGTTLKRQGRVDQPVDPERVRRLVEAVAAR